MSVLAKPNRGVGPGLPITRRKQEPYSQNGCVGLKAQPFFSKANAAFKNRSEGDGKRSQFAGQVKLKIERRSQIDQMSLTVSNAAETAGSDCRDRSVTKLSGVSIRT